MPTLLPLRSPVTPADHAALAAFCPRAIEAAKRAFASLRARGYISAQRIEWRSGILGWAGMPDHAGLIVTVHTDPETPRFIQKEQTHTREVREHLIAAGFTVGGIPTDDPRIVIVRGPAVSGEVAA